MTKENGISPEGNGKEIQRSEANQVELFPSSDGSYLVSSQDSTMLAQETNRKVLEGMVAAEVAPYELFLMGQLKKLHAGMGQRDSLRKWDGLHMRYKASAKLGGYSSRMQYRRGAVNVLDLQPLSYTQSLLQERTLDHTFPETSPNTLHIQFDEKKKIEVISLAAGEDLDTILTQANYTDRQKEFMHSVITSNGMEMYVGKKWSPALSYNQSGYSPQVYDGENYRPDFMKVTDPNYPENYLNLLRGILGLIPAKDINK